MKAFYVVIVVFLIIVAIFAFFFFTGGTSGFQSLSNFACGENAEPISIDIGEESSTILCDQYCRESDYKFGGQVREGHCYCKDCKKK